MDEFINGIKETLNKCKNISSVSATITGSMGEKRWKVESEATIKSVKSIKEETELIDGFDTSSLDSSIQIATTESIPGQEIEEIIDVVLGNVVGDEKVKKDPSEIERMNDLREKAINVMTEVAENLDADAIIGVDIKSSRLPGSKTGGTDSDYYVEMEILAYGTAVKLK